MSASTTDSNVRRARPLLWMVATLTLLFGLLLSTFLGAFSQDPITQGVYPAIAGVSALYFSAVLGLPWAIRRPDIRVKSWAPWAAGVLTLVSILGVISLWWLDRWGLGYQWIQTLKVVSGPYGWGDLKLYFEWLTCSQQGINPLTADPGMCTDARMNYGPGFLWWTPFAFLSPAADALGVLTAIICALAIVWLARRSTGLGVLVLVAASVSSAWITLIERGNFDELIIWVAIAIVFLTYRYAGLWPWIVGGVLIVILGTWKYYPFAMVLSLIPALRLRRGWLVVTGVLGAGVLYLLVYWDAAIGDMETHTGLVGGIGRTTLAAFFAGEETPSSAINWADGAVLALIALAALWGASVGFSQSQRNLATLERPAMLAISGAVTILGSVVLAGSGFIYKSALLLLAVPLLSALTRSRISLIWRSGVMMLGVVVLALFLEWNLLTSSAALQLAAGFTLGLSLTVLLRRVLPHRRRSTHDSGHHIDTPRVTT